MKKELLFAFLAMFLMSLTAITGVYAVETDPKPVSLIKQHEDITGDGIKDDILLYGIPYQKEDSVYKLLILKVKLSNGKRYEEKLNYGLNPEVKYIDLTHDGVKDVFLSIPTGQSGGVTNHYLYSAKNFAFSKIPLPDLNMQGQFTNGYKAKISIPATKEIYIFDLMIRKEMYESLGMYRNGKLNEPTELMILPYGDLIPLTTQNSEYGLKGVQKITGTSESDTIAFVVSSWYYSDGEWKLMDTDIREIRN